MNVKPPPPPPQHVPLEGPPGTRAASHKRAAPTGDAKRAGRKSRAGGASTAELMARAARALPERVPDKELAHGQPGYYVDSDDGSEKG